MTLVYPSITWSGGTHTWVAGTPVDDPHSFPHLESEVSRVPATGEQDSWVDGIFARVRFALRWVPNSGIATDHGYHYPDPGLYAFIVHQRQHKDDFTFKPDKDGAASHTCRLIEDSVRPERSGVHKRVDLTIEDVDGNVFTEY